MLGADLVAAALVMAAPVAAATAIALPAIARPLAVGRVVATAAIAALVVPALVAVLLAIGASLGLVVGLGPAATILAAPIAPLAEIFLGLVSCEPLKLAVVEVLLVLLRHELDETFMVLVLPHAPGRLVPLAVLLAEGVIKPGELQFFTWEFDVSVTFWQLLADAKHSLPAQAMRLGCAKGVLN